eukprot:353985-Chlamydomonas_euryale.AAC.2
MHAIATPERSQCNTSVKPCNTSAPLCNTSAKAWSNPSCTSVCNTSAPTSVNPLSSPLTATVARPQAIRHTYTINHSARPPPRPSATRHTAVPQSLHRARWACAPSHIATSSAATRPAVTRTCPFVAMHGVCLRRRPHVSGGCERVF